MFGARIGYSRFWYRGGRTNFSEFAYSNQNVRYISGEILVNFLAGRNRCARTSCLINLTARVFSLLFVDPNTPSNNPPGNTKLVFLSTPKINHTSRALIKDIFCHRVRRARDEFPLLRTNRARPDFSLFLPSSPSFFFLLSFIRSLCVQNQIFTSVMADSMRARCGLNYKLYFCVSRYSIVFQLSFDAHEPRSPTTTTSVAAASF